MGGFIQERRFDDNFPSFNETKKMAYQQQDFHPKNSRTQNIGYASVPNKKHVLNYSTNNHSSESQFYTKRSVKFFKRNPNYQRYSLENRGNSGKFLKLCFFLYYRKLAGKVSE